MIKSGDKILADELVRRNALTRAVADTCLAELQNSQESLQGYLLQRGLLPERQILAALSSAHHLPEVDLKTVLIDKGVVAKVPVRFAWYYKFMPIKVEGRVLTIATATPFDVKFHDDIRAHLGFEPTVVLAREADVLDALNKHYGLAANTVDRLTKETARKSVREEETAPWVEDLEKAGDDASVGTLVNEIIFEAYKKRATDIHIEPYRHKVRVRYRIDGVLADAHIPSAVKEFLPSIISRIKLMASLSIVEKRLPQDGSAVVKTREQDLDLRVSTIPTTRGESMVIRILPTNVTLLSLEKLGLDQANLRLFRELIARPHGIILVTGPTGSGKTTTLYACLNELNSPDRKIITLEDPLEYELEGITQIQVNPKINLDFSAGLRSILRHDPDIIMVGEIRDVETAEIAIRTALTGHLVFSTLHTNDAASGVTRLLEMGLEPFLVSSSIQAFIAQRLVRIICPHCKEEAGSGVEDIKKEIVQSLKHKDPQSIKIFQGKGCDHCNGTGYYGRTAIYEVLAVDEDIRSLILKKPRAEEIKMLGIKNGMMTLRQDGWRKVLSGITTAAEVIDVTARDERPDEGRAARNAKETPPRASAPPATRVVSPDVLKAADDYNSRVYARAGLAVGVCYMIVQQDDGDLLRLTTDGVEHRSISRDISAGGVRFIAGTHLPVGAIIDLKIQLYKDDKSIDCLAKICRVEEDSASPVFYLAAYFLDITSSDRVRLDHYVRARVAQDPSAPGG